MGCACVAHRKSEKPESPWGERDSRGEAWKSRVESCFKEREATWK